MQLSSQQEEAYRLIKAWLATSDQKFVLGGYAGTGKSTLAALIADELNRSVHYCAFTGKAAQVLRDKGCDGATTVHSAIYKMNPETEQFELDLESHIRNKSLVIVDEYSMLPQEITDDLHRLARKVLYLGDPFQLPPVTGDCVITPDYTLTQVHRQALDSPVLRAATNVRETGRIGSYRNDGDFIFCPKSNITPETYDSVTQVLCGRNETRQRINKWFRQRKCIDSPFPVKDEKLICLQNNQLLDIWNGIIAPAESDAEYGDADKPYGSYAIDWNDKSLIVLSADVLGEPVRHYQRGKERLDYAYCITVHKSQGSEYDSILVCLENQDPRHIYTAITRAKNKCIIVN
jgi:exodeoxyribonuclease-5